MNPTRINLNRARHIIAIYEHGGVMNASRKLFISQPSLSQTVRLVEQELGITIFEKGVSPPTLTYAGEKYLDTARSMLAQEEQLIATLDNIRNDRSGRLRLGISIQRGMQLLPLVLPEFSRRYPDVRLLLQEQGSELLEKLVRDRKLDLALVTTEPAIPRLQYDLIEAESYVLLTGAQNPLLSRCRPGETVSLSQISGERFVALKPGHNIRVIQDRVFAAQGITPPILLETDSIEAAIRVTVACGCYMLCPQVFVRSNAAIAGSGVCYRLRELTEERHFYACYYKDTYLPAYFRDFIRLVQEASRQSLAYGVQGAEGV